VPTLDYVGILCLTFVLGWLASLIVASHTWAFVINPFAGQDYLRSTELILFWFGWMALVAGPGVVSIAALMGHFRPISYLGAIALVHPLSVLLLQVTLRVQQGRWYFSYLTDNIWFLLSDAIIPLLLWIAHKSLRNTAPHLGPELNGDV